MKKVRNRVCLLFLVISCSVSAQQADLQSWNSLRISKKIHKRTTLSLKEGIRFRENISLISKYFTDIKISHRIKKTDFSFAIGYRFSNNYDIDFSKEMQSRYYLDFISKYDYKRYEVTLRDRLQYQGNDHTIYKPLYRQKIGLSYNIRKTSLEPSIACEYFINFKGNFEKMRYTISFSYDLLKDLDLDVYYRVQQELNAADPSTLYILGSSVSYKL